MGHKKAKARTKWQMGRIPQVPCNSQSLQVFIARDSILNKGSPNTSIKTALITKSLSLVKCCNFS